VEPWIETIIRLWDDGEFYRQASEAARCHAERWRPEHLAPLYRDFFSSLVPQPAPPLLPLASLQPSADKRRPELGLPPT
jgi:hypothetical protein